MQARQMAAAASKRALAAQAGPRGRGGESIVGCRAALAGGLPNAHLPTCFYLHLRALAVPRCRKPARAMAPGPAPRRRYGGAAQALSGSGGRGPARATLKARRASREQVGARHSSSSQRARQVCTADSTRLKPM